MDRANLAAVRNPGIHGRSNNSRRDGLEHGPNTIAFLAAAAGSVTEHRKLVVISGSSGYIGTAIIRRLAERYDIAALDEPGPPYPERLAYCVPVDMESRESVDRALESVGKKFGRRVASVVHLAAYYDFGGEPSPKYYSINVLGTRRLIDALQSFDVEQFVFASTMLVHRPTQPGCRARCASSTSPSACGSWPRRGGWAASRRASVPGTVSRWAWRSWPLRFLWASSGSPMPAGTGTSTEGSHASSS